MNTPHEALRLADALESHDGHFNINAQMDAATLLRTQYARIVELEKERDALHVVLKDAALFLHHAWCDVQMNDYSFGKLQEAMANIDAAIAARTTGEQK